MPNSYLYIDSIAIKKPIEQNYYSNSPSPFDTKDFEIRYV
jgi:hypothetical protein